MGKESNFLEKKYPAKILLFGEHIVLNGAKSLAMPFNKFEAYWNPEKEDSALQPFYDYLKSLSFIPTESIENLKSLAPKFITDIPKGYGMGSSGALCAAVYEYFFPNFGRKENELIIKELALMECFFHGKSSGLDALVILINKPLLFTIEGIKVLKALEKSQLSKLFLIDSGISRSSKIPIKSFINNQKNKKVIAKLVFVNNEIVTSYLKKNQKDFAPLMRKISELQLHLFDSMITPYIREFWIKGLKSNDYFIKLCGAGGGGYFLAWGEPSVIQALPFKKLAIIQD